jgi:pimeloyl-ACP methyl ester carboxylesterase
VAARWPDRVSHLAMVGTAFPMRVSQVLLENSLNAPQKAIDMVNQFSHATIAPPPSVLGPGTWVPGGSRALMRRVLASNREVNVFHRGFMACDSYAGGEASMAQVKAPTLFILGRQDQMTPPRSAQSLVRSARQGRVVEVDAGHQMMSEAPDAVLDALIGFLSA